MVVEFIVIVNNQSRDAECSKMEVRYTLIKLAPSLTNSLILQSRSFNSKHRKSNSIKSNKTKSNNH